MDIDSYLQQTVNARDALVRGIMEVFKDRERPDYLKEVVTIPDITEQEAKELIEYFYTLYPQLKEWKKL